MDINNPQLYSTAIAIDMESDCSAIIAVDVLGIKAASVAARASYTSRHTYVSMDTGEQQATSCWMIEKTGKEQFQAS